MDFDQLITSMQDLDASLRKHVTQSANVGLTFRNWLVGAYLVEFEQNGKGRAEYGKNLIQQVSRELKIKGLTATTLELCRRLFCEYPQIPQTLSVESRYPIMQTLSAVFYSSEKNSSISQTPAEFSSFLENQQFAKRPDFALPFSEILPKLSFSHFVELLRIHDPIQRAFYEIECMKAAWSVRELKRQVGSLLYERLGLSSDKQKLLRITEQQTTRSDQFQASDIIKDPYIFEFLGLQPKEVFRENDLETALLDHLQEFLLELGSGFCFEDRQKKIRIGQSDYFVDLVFYHRRLHCHVLIELKAEPFNHVNASQLNTYVNYYKKNERQEGDNPPIGLLLCTDKDHALVEYALGGMDENLFVSAYQIALPSPEELQRFLEQHYSL